MPANLILHTVQSQLLAGARFLSLCAGFRIIIRTPDWEMQTTRDSEAGFLGCLRTSVGTYPHGTLPRKAACLFFRSCFSCAAAGIWWLAFVCLVCHLAWYQLLSPTLPHSTLWPHRPCQACARNRTQKCTLEALVGESKVLPWFLSPRAGTYDAPSCSAYPLDSVPVEEL